MPMEITKSEAWVHVSVPEMLRSTLAFHANILQLDDAYSSIKCRLQGHIYDLQTQQAKRPSHGSPRWACQEWWQVLRHAALTALKPSRGTQTGLVTLAQTPITTAPGTRPVLTATTAATV